MVRLKLIFEQSSEILLVCVELNCIGFGHALAKYSSSLYFKV